MSFRPTSSSSSRFLSVRNSKRRLDDSPLGVALNPILGDFANPLKNPKTITKEVRRSMIDFERTFDNTAVGYDRSRPTYAEELYHDIFKYKQVDSKSNVLEIGLGTGKATQPILETHCRFVGIEPGENMASLAKERFKNDSNFSLYIQTLQEYVCPPESFDFIYSATAFHWIQEEYGYRRVYELLKSGGVFARFAYHAGADKERRALTEEIQELYEKYLSQSQTPKEYSEEDAKELAETAIKYGFTNTEYKLYHLTKDFTADEYMELLRTYPNHMAIEAINREKLFSGIYSAINKNGGIITVYYTMDLELARKP